MKSKIPTYKCTVDHLENTGIMAVSFVEFPAIEREFVALQKKQETKLSLNKQKQLLTGALLIPDQLIYRNDSKMGEYYITFSKPEIEKIALKMMRTRKPLDSTTHQHELSLKGNHLVELWIVKDSKKDKSVALGLGEMPEGTLMVTYKIQDTKYWQNEVMTGNVKGFSLEGIFNFNHINMKENKQKVATQATKKGIPAFFKSIAAFLESSTEADVKDLVSEAEKDETNSGSPYIIFDLAEGGEIWVAEDGFCTLNGGEQVPAGEHALTDGNFIIIDDDGLLVITETQADGAQSTEPNIDMAKQRAKAFFESKKKQNKSEIAELKARIAELEKQPSTCKATPAQSTKGYAELSHTEKMAAVIASRRNRMKK